MQNGNCRLCSKNADLMESHIVPKFVYRWMKSTGGSYFRGSEDPEKRKQDGTKEHLLCSSCEQLFSKREAYFKQSLFDPYIANAATSMPYDDRLFYFCISIAWRVLIHDLSHEDIGEYAFIDQLHEAEQEWRQFLLGGDVPPTYNDTHLFCTDVGADESQPVRRMNLYYTRAVDGTIASNVTSCAVYWKFARFVSFTAVTEFDQSLWIGTRIDPSGGVLEIPQEMRDGILGEFMIDRARLAAVAATTPLTEKQARFHDDRIAANPGAFHGSDLGKVLKADAETPVNPHTLYPSVGRNDQCPCGSGKKYKKCHGK